MIRSPLHRPGATCMVRIHGMPRDCWMIAVVVSALPLKAEVVADCPVWKGAVVSRNDAYIRVDPATWPRFITGHRPKRRFSQVW